MDALERGRCAEAVEKLQRLVDNYPGSRLVAEAQYHLAEAYFCSEDYVNAAFEYQRLIQTYPSSQWVAEAQFKIAECYYQQARRAELDQTETRNALRHFRTFLDDNPHHLLVDKARERIADCRNRLAYKTYLAARLYQRQNHRDAARIYYDQILNEYPDTRYYYKALYRMGEMAFARDDRQTARRYWAEVARDSDDEDLQRRAGERLAQVYESSSETGN